MAPILTSLMNIYIQLGISGCIKVGNKLTDKKKKQTPVQCILFRIVLKFVFSVF